MSDINQFEGDVYLSLLDNADQPIGFFGPIECFQFQPGRSTEQGDTIDSRKRDTWGQPIDTLPSTTAANLSMQFVEIPTELLGVAFAANPTVVSTTGASVSSESVFVSKVGMYRLANINLATSPAPTVKDTEDDPGPKTYTAGTDYVIVPHMGLIKIVPGGAIATDLAALQAITPGAELELDIGYTHSSISYDRLLGETVQTSRVAVLFDGKNRKSGKNFSMYYNKVEIPAPDEIFDLMSLELISLTLNGRCLTGAGYSAPYEVRRER